MQLQNQLKKPFNLKDTTHLLIAGVAAVPMAALVLTVFVAASGTNQAFDTLLAKASTDTSSCAYDVNLDGTVNKSDLDIVASHYGPAQPAGSSIYDVNHDGMVNSADLGLVSKSNGQTCAANLPNVPTVPAQVAPASPAATSTPSTISNVDKYLCDSDVNHDGVIDDNDLRATAANMNKSGTGDVNHDGVANSTDLGIIAANKGRSCSTTGTGAVSTQSLSAADKLVCDSDVNHDGVIDDRDLQAIAGNFNKSGVGDVNHDGIANSTDSGIVAANKGKSCPTSAATQTLTIAPGVTLEKAYVGTALCKLRGDLNGDGVISSADLGLAVANYGKASKYDANGDGIMNSADMGLVVQNYGQRCNPKTVAQSVAQSADPVVQQSALCRFKGDVNGDGVVNSADIGLVVQNYGKTNSKYDTNGDGVINSLDMQVVTSSYGLRCK